MLEKLIKENLTSFYESFDNWEDAIRASYKGMLAHQYVDEKYVQGVIDTIHEYGPYIVIAPMIAMPHTSNQKGFVKQSSLEFMKVNTPVEFDDKDEGPKKARLFFALAAQDEVQHLHNIRDLMNILLNEHVVKELLEAQNNDDLLAIARKYRI